MSSINIIIDWFVPAYKAGGPIRSIKNMADHLQDELDISILCSNKDHDKTVLPVPVNQWIQKDKYKVYYTDRKFRGLQKALPGSDVIYINGIYSLHYNLLPLLFFKGRKIIAVRGMLDPGGLSQKSLKKKLYLRFWKWAKLHKSCEYHASSDTEKQNIEAVLGKQTKVWVIQNLPGVITYKPVPHKEKGSLVLCTVALVSAMKNHLPVIQSLSNCKADVVYNIYGPIKDKTYWQTCLKAIEKLPANVNVIYHGIISPELIPDAIADCHVYIQPSKSENFSHSLYDALMTGRPVITSHFTPWTHLHNEHAGVNVTIDDTKDITSTVERFAAMDITELQQWGNAARNYAAKAMDIETIKKQYISMFTAKHTSVINAQ